MNKLALEGIKVVELGTHVVIPTVGRILADCGAEVIKVENPVGEEWRYIGRNNGMPATDTENAYFTNRNSNKKFLGLDLKSEEGTEILIRLISEADVFLTNVRLKSLQKMGIDYESLKARFPNLVYGHFTGFGYKGPDKDRPGLDMAAFWARSGALADWASDGSFPAKPIGAFGDGASANFMVNGVLAGLIARLRGGEGTLVSTSLYGCGIWLSSVGVISAQEPYNLQYPLSRYEPAAPLSHIYECKDHNYIIMSVLRYDAQHEDTFRMLGMEEYIGDPRFDSLVHAKEHIVELTKIINEKFMARTRDEWADIFQENGLVYEKLMHYNEITHDEQAIANDYLEDVTFASGTSIKIPRFPVMFSEYGLRDITTTGSIGRDSDEILRNAGYAADEIAAMEDHKAVVIGTSPVKSVQ